MYSETRFPKLIACDIDGTLMDYSESSFSPRLFPLIRRLKSKGIAFCPASGRQYTSLRGLFAPVADELTYLCENGGLIMASDGRVLGKTVMDRSRAEALSRDIWALEDCEVMLSGQDTSYVMMKQAGLDENLRHFVGNNVQIIRSPQEVPEDIIKISAFCRQGAARYAPMLGPKWNEIFPMAIGGPRWLDFALADKGVGLCQLAEALGLDPEDMMAFGDNSNDLPMLEAAGMPYVVNRSPLTDLPARYRRCERVEDVLEELLDALDRPAQ